MKFVKISFLKSSRIVAVLLLSYTASAQHIYSLTDVIDSARCNSPALKVLKLDIDAAQANVLSAGLRPNPKLNNQTLLLSDRNNFEPGTRWNSAYNRQIWWQVTKQVKWPGQRRLAIEAAQSDVAVSQRIYNDQLRSVAFTVGKSWITCWALKNRIKLISQMRESLDDLMSPEIKKSRKVKTALTDQARIELLSKQFALQQEVALQDLSNELQNLKLLIGASDSLQVVASDSIVMSLKIGHIDSLRSSSGNDRSDVLLAKTAIVSKTVHSKYENAMAVPQPELGVIYNPQNNVPYLGIFATIDLPFFNRNQGERRKAQVLEQQAKQELSATLLQVQTDVATAYNSYRVQAQNRGRYSGISDQASQILQEVRFTYLNGGTTIVDMLDAQKNWYDSRLFYYQALQAYYQSYLLLLFNSGMISRM